MTTGSEMRQNRLTGGWTIYAPVRGERPHDVARMVVPQHVPQFDPECAFCPGNEALLPPIIAERRARDGQLWQTRVVFNKYPVLTEGGNNRRFLYGPYLTMQGTGCHEVLIEGPRHDLDLALMTHADVRTVIEMYHERYLDMYARPGIAMTLLFRNHGPDGGASLRHPHSQLVALSLVPERVRQREQLAQDYYDTWGRCGYCDVLFFEADERQRVVLENQSFLAFVPYAAEVPFEVWIVPRRHAADFATLTEQEKNHLADALRRVLWQLYTKAGDPAYNYMIHTASRDHADVPWLHWYVQIRPRVAIEAGFEIASGMHINVSLPESDAELLRVDSAPAPKGE